MQYGNSMLLSGVTEFGYCYCYKSVQSGAETEPSNEDGGVGIIMKNKLTRKSLEGHYTYTSVLKFSLPKLLLIFVLIITKIHMKSSVVVHFTPFPNS